MSLSIATAHRPAFPVVRKEQSPPPAAAKPARVAPSAPNAEVPAWAKVLERGIGGVFGLLGGALVGMMVTRTPAGLLGAMGTGAVAGLVTGPGVAMGAVCGSGVAAGLSALAIATLGLAGPWVLPLTVGVVVASGLAGGWSYGQKLQAK